jgi:uncharacterized protein (DUF58 family)
VAASLACAAARAGQRARLVTAAGLDLPVHGGPPAVRRFLDALCELRQTGAPGDALADVGSPAGGVLVIVSAEAGADDAPARFRPRGGIVLITFPAPGAGRVGGTGDAATVRGVTVLRVGDAAEAVRRWNTAVR